MQVKLQMLLNNTKFVFSKHNILLCVDQTGQSCVVTGTSMEYFAVRACSEGYLTVHAKGRDVCILKSKNKSSYRPLFSQTCTQQIVCCSVEEGQADNDISSSDLNIVIGLLDGSLILLNVEWNAVKVYNVGSLKQPVGALHCGPGFVLVSSISGESALLYSQPILASHDRPRFIRLDVDFSTAAVGTHHHHRALPSIPSTITSFPISNKCCMDKKEHQDLVASYFDASTAVLLTSASTQSTPNGQQPAPESELLLIGCTDGTLWWLQTPHRSSVLDLYDGGESSNITDLEDTVRLTAKLLHTFHTPIQCILFTNLSLRAKGNNNASNIADGSIKSICVVECNGKATLLGMENTFSKSSWTFQFPADCNLSSITFYKGMFLFVDNRSGMLCAATIDTVVPTANKSVSAFAYAATVIEHTLTPTTGPRIQSFSIAKSSNDTTVECDMLVLQTSEGIVELPLHFEESPTQSTAVDVIATLQHACGGGSLRHPYTLAPIQIYSSCAQPDIPIDSILPTATNPSATSAITNTGELVQLETVAAQLCEAGEENENILKQSLQADLEMLQLTALLQELPDTLKVVYNNNTKSGSASSSSSAILSNSTRSIEVWYRFRTEPTPYNYTINSISSSSNDVCTYIDITISTHSLQAMRALQGRTLTISVHSTYNTTSLHCSADTSSAHILLQPACRNNSDRTIDTCEYEYRVTIPVHHINQLSSYRLVMSVAVDAPRSIHTTCSDGVVQVSKANSALLCIVDHIIPLSGVLPFILTASSDNTLGAMQQLCGDRTMGSEEYSLTLGPTTNNTATDTKGIVDLYQSAVDKHTQHTNYQYKAALHIDNLLQAAFLPAERSSAAAFHLGSSSSGNVNTTSRTSVHKGKLQKHRLTLSTARRAPAPSSAPRHSINNNSSSNNSNNNNNSNNSSSNNKRSGVAGGQRRAGGVTVSAQGYLGASTIGSTMQSTGGYNSNGSSSSSNGIDGDKGDVTVSSNSAVLLASIAAEMHTQELCCTSTTGYHPHDETYADFGESDAALLSTDLQQMMIQTAHLVRRNDPTTCIENSTVITDYDAETTAKMWNIYRSLRESVV